MTSIVSIDIESTGLDENRDAIIEIAAVKFNGRRVEDEFTTLVNPGKAIPDFITGLTGIDNAMVRSAPRLSDIAHKLTAFVGDSPILGHNVKFDIGFLRKAGLFQFNQTIDTYELASVLMPTASRYNLGSLGQQLSIPLPATHRALDDARVTQAAYVRLLDMARELPLETLEEIVELGNFVDWDAGWVFEQALQLQAKDGIKPKQTRSASKPTIGAAKKDFAPIEKNEEPTALDAEEIASVLEYGGPFSQYFEAYEQRPQQVDMLKAVANALSSGNHLIVEAGTGVGKSFAYLVPAAMFAVQNNTRVVVSTNTINLQDQLIKKDIPDLQAALNLDVRAAVMKGRGNYLCPRKFEFMRSHGPTNANEMRVLAKIMVWQLDNDSGDRNELNLTGPIEREVWMRLSAEDDNCTTETCLGRMSGRCAFHRAKQAAQAAHLLIVNHALLLSDVSTGSKVLPEYDYVIVDEAHHIESAVTSALSFRMTQNDLDRILKELGGSSAGLLGRMLTETHQTIQPSEFGLLQQKAKHATDQAFRVEQLAKQFFNALSDFIATLRERERQLISNYSWQMRITPAARSLPGWDDVEITWSQVSETMGLLLKTLDEIYKALGEIYSNGHENVEDTMGTLSSVMRRMVEAETASSGMMHKPSNELIYWVEVNPRGERLSLNAAPLRVGPLVEKHLWLQKASVVMASATLTTHGEFRYLRNTLSANEVDTLALGSPFDYESSTLLYVANDMPEPNAQGYQQALDKAIISTAKATGGRMLVLFTSYAALKKTAQAITGPLGREDIFVFEQGEGASPNALLESFKTTDRAVLLGTRSFWEGVDVPGDSLSVVIITKLPFGVPSDPIISARSELYEDSFNEYYLPESILKFRQGFGRLIRTASDHGVVAIFDRRVLTKQYGRLFLESLPQCTARQGAATGLAKMAGDWLGV